MILDQHPDGLPGKAIGYWFNDHHPDLPKPENYVSLNWRPLERDAVIKYLKAGHVKGSWRGWSNCRMCGCMNGSQCLGDGVFVWPEGFAHYVEVHGVRPPDEFVRHVLGKVLTDGWPGPDVEYERQCAEAAEQTAQFKQEWIEHSAAKKAKRGK